MLVSIHVYFCLFHCTGCILLYSIVFQFILLYFIVAARSISHQDSNRSSSSESSLLYSPYVPVGGPSGFECTNRLSEIRDQLTKFDTVSVRN